MTISEAMGCGLLRLRLPVWNSRAYLKLDKLPEGIYYSPWCVLFDPFTDEALGCRPVKMIIPEGSGWLEYVGEPVPDEAAGVANAECV